VASGGSGGGGGDGAGAPRHAGTQLVTRRTLVDRAQLDGTLGYGSERAAMDRLGGTITWLPTAGAVVRPGRPLFAVDGQPVILMAGRVPAWRTLSAGVSGGVDVQQLERGLAALGYDPGTVDETFTPTTAGAVSRWQAAVGLPRTGSVELGRIVFLPGARRVAKVEASLGSTGGSGASPAAWDGGGARYAYADYVANEDSATTPAATDPTTTPSTTPTMPTTPTSPRTTPTTPTTTPTTPSTAPRATPSSPAADDSPRGDDSPSGDDSGGGAAATKVLATTSTVRVVTADLDATDQQLARVGGRALITLPDGRRVRGRIVRVGTVASADDSGNDGAAPGGDGSGDPTLPLTIRLRSTHAAGRLDQAPVAVELARTTRRNVLAVPVAALLARPGGGYGVRLMRGTGTTAQVATVPVQPGLFADGYVEVSGGGVHAGDRVEVPK
jgi:peptidoglycan hydrolase-like protein with peptidoglycan-binding domain